MIRRYPRSSSGSGSNHRLNSSERGKAGNGERKNKNEPKKPKARDGAFGFLVVAGNRLVDYVAVKSGCGAEYIVGELEWTGVEPSRATIGFRSIFGGNDSRVSELYVPPTDIQDRDGSD